MGRMVTGAFDNIQVTNDADQDIFAITAGANNKIKLHWLELYSAVTVAENLRMKLRRVDLAAAGTAVTEALLDEDDGTITATMITLDTTPDATPGDLIAAFQWDQLAPLVYQPVPKAIAKVQEAGIIVLHLETALAATTSMSGWAIWEEL